MAIQIGDQYRHPGRSHPTKPWPERIYTVYEIRGEWDIRCHVDPPLTDGRTATLVGAVFLAKLPLIYAESADV